MFCSCIVSRCDCRGWTPACLALIFGLGSHSAKPIWGRRNPKGCQSVAGGRSKAKTSGHKTELNGTLEGCQSFPQRAHLPRGDFLAPLRGAISFWHLPGVFAALRPPATFFQPAGLRCSRPTWRWEHRLNRIVERNDLAVFSATGNFSLAAGLAAKTAILEGHLIATAPCSAPLPWLQLAGYRGA